MEEPAISREALEKYLNRRVEELRDMKRYVDEKRFDDIAMLSHRIKGSAQTFGLETVGHIAEKLEREAETHAEAEIESLLKEMEQEVHGAIEKLN